MYNCTVYYKCTTMMLLRRKAGLAHRVPAKHAALLHACTRLAGCCMTLSAQLGEARHVTAQQTRLPFYVHYSIEATRPAALRNPPHPMQALHGRGRGLLLAGLQSHERSMPTT
jgi:hypothetical protein